MKADSLELTLLFDCYSGMLTEKQQTCFDLYYNQDLSLAEIAEEAGISRQGVHDTLVRTEAALLDMEARLGVAAHARRTQDAVRVLTFAENELRAAGQTDPAERVRAALNLLKE